MKRGWNGSGGSGKSTQTVKSATTFKKCLCWLGEHWWCILLAVAVVCVIVVCVCWISTHKDATPPIEEEEANTNKTAIATNAPARVDVPKPQKPKTYGEMSREEKLQSIRAKYGDNIPDNLKPVVYYLENPPQKTFHPARTKFPYFNRRSEREIASVLNVEPGTWMMGRARFGDKFDKDLAAALNEKIEFLDDDADDVRAMKQAVVDTKKELAERIKNGERASDIMNDTIDELYALGQYRRELQEQVGAVRRNAEYSDQDVEDVVNAANKMLEAKGLPPLRMPNMLIRHASLQKAAARAAQEQSTENK